MANAALTILLVEDNPGDVVLFSEAVDASGSGAKVLVACDGIKAMQFLRKEGGYAQSPRPDVVVLDLNLPAKSGREVLAEIKADPALSGMPVVILTTSTWEAHLCREYAAGRCLYLTKTGNFRELLKMVNQIVAFALAATRG